MLAVVSPVLHKYPLMPVGALSVVLSPEHKTLDPTLVIDAEGFAFTVTDIAVDVVLQPSLVVPVTA
jgi:hypothetical protein